MTEFEKYLAKWVLHLDEDCCSKCANCSANTNGELCDNLRSHPDTAPDDDICIAGMREYFERHREVDDGIDH